MGNWNVVAKRSLCERKVLGFLSKGLAAKGADRKNGHSLGMGRRQASVALVVGPKKRGLNAGEKSCQSFVKGVSLAG